MLIPGGKEVGIMITSAILLSFIFIVAKIYLPASRLLPNSELRLERSALMDEWWQKEQFYRHKLSLAGKDSISLTIDLQDSSLTLSLLGVQLKKCKVLSCQISNSIRKIDQTAWLDSGFQIMDEQSSIVKHPVVYRKAPKDTVEAKGLAEQEANEVPEDDVYFAFFLNKQLMIVVDQYEEPVKNNHKGNNNRLIRNNPDHHFIRLSLNKNDAKSIYRSMPAQGSILIRM